MQPAPRDRRRRRRPLPQSAVHTRKHDLPVRALDDVVGRASLEPEDLVARRMSRAGQDDHRERDARAARAQCVQHLGRLHVGHVVVQQHQVWRGRADSLQRLGPTCGNFDRVARTAQKFRGQLSCPRLVVNHQQLGGHRLQSPPAK